MSRGRLLGARREAPIIVARDRSKTSLSEPAALPVNHVTGAPRSVTAGWAEEERRSPRVHHVLGTPLKIDPLHLPLEK